MPDLKVNCNCRVARVDRLNPGCRGQATKTRRVTAFGPERLAQEASRHTLQPSALVHEAGLRLTEELQCSGASPSLARSKVKDPDDRR